MQATNVFHPRLLISTVNTAPRVQCWSFQVLLCHESAPHVEHEKLIWERRSLKTSVCDSHEAVNTDRWSCRGTGQRSYILLIFGLSNAIFCNESYFIMTDFNDFHRVGSLKVLNISTAVSQEHPVTRQSDHTPTLLLSVSLFIKHSIFIPIDSMLSSFWSLRSHWEWITTLPVDVSQAYQEGEGRRVGAAGGLILCRRCRLSLNDSRNERKSKWKHFSVWATDWSAWHDPEDIYYRLFTLPGESVESALTTNDRWENWKASY